MVRRRRSLLEWVRLLLCNRRHDGGSKNRTQAQTTETRHFAMMANMRGNVVGIRGRSISLRDGGPDNLVATHRHGSDKGLRALMRSSRLAVAPLRLLRQNHAPITAFRWSRSIFRWIHHALVSWIHRVLGRILLSRVSMSSWKGRRVVGWGRVTAVSHVLRRWIRTVPWTSNVGARWRRASVTPAGRRLHMA
jgi:hypothetical protein